jgi:hypothetical protein
MPKNQNGGLACENFDFSSWQHCFLFLNIIRTTTYPKMKTQRLCYNKILNLFEKYNLSLKFIRHFEFSRRKFFQKFYFYPK